MLIAPDPQHNHLLAALSPVERERVCSDLQLVPMPLGKVLYESGDVLRQVYFPTDCIVSLLNVLEDGTSAEIAVVGDEGVIGVALFMGGETTPRRAVVRIAGHAYQLIGQQLEDEFHRNGEMRLLLLRYTQAHHPDGPDRGLQPASFGGPAAVPLASCKSSGSSATSVDRSRCWPVRSSSTFPASAMAL